MRNLLLTLLLNLTCLISQSQVWAPIGAKWYYSDVSWGFPTIASPNILESVGDTTINGQVCRIIQGYCMCGYNQSRNYLYFDNNKIFMYIESTNSFHILYDFSANAGESWTIIPPDNPSDSFQVHVDSVYYKIINGDSIKFQFVENTIIGIWDVWGEIAENIGNTSFCFYPAYSTCDPWTGHLRCYSDSSKTIKFDTIPCDTTYIISALSQSDLTEEISIYPNPCVSKLSIDNCNDDSYYYSFKLYSIIGELQIEINNLKGNSTIDIDKINNGFFIVELTFPNRQKSYMKIIKE